ncbi:putative cytochrome P450 oxidoreductase GliC-like protein [Annulohypoxylon truncatum]|uniref:putative cytochrome P450 oxidoreductase GliC-like protein n=1 Tax=Annulohypoxylon truncatum TaxID=327061 RepID=UPI002008E8FC|nr:putative cytochrome P450 oxidoreductase GliC-like protein [Annulohypoxylon truncatum]KAI1208208.1 putative cytochrome P450 oxidoreductase GliC-like protein [Annulohypoxylon truncatum]
MMKSSLISINEIYTFYARLPIYALSSTMLLAVAFLFVILLLRSQAIKTCLSSLLSRIINIVLRSCYPIKHVENGRDLPSLPYVFPNGQGNTEKFLHGRTKSANWEREYGGLYRLWAGIKGEVVLTKHTHVETVFHDSNKHTKAHANDSGYLMDRLLGSCLGLISGSPWNAVKSGVEAPFLHRSASTYVTDIQDFTKAYMRALNAESEPLRDHGKLHPVHDLKLLPFLFVARIIYGSLSAELEKELRELIPLREELFKSVVGGGITRFSIARFLPLPAIRALRDFKRRWAEWNDKAHAYALQTKRAEATPIIGMYRCVDEGTITREQLLQTLDEMLFANIDVTMGGISWTLVFLAAHPSVQKMLRSEIQTSSSHAASRNAYLLSSWTTTPTLLGACILESARLRPLAAFSVPQSCPTPRVLDGFEVPAGTNFVVDSYALNIRDPFWGPDRERFRPQRWLERHKSGRDLRYRYWRFGFGPRTCLGKYVAEFLLRAVVVEVLENWSISLETTEQQRSKEVESENGCDRKEEEDMDWPWDDEMWIHHPDLFLKCRPLTRPT